METIIVLDKPICCTIVKRSRLDKEVYREALTIQRIVLESESSLTLRVMSHADAIYLSIKE